MMDTPSPCSATRGVHPTLCHLQSTMFHFGVDLLYSTTEPQHDLPSLASLKGQMASPFSWTIFSKVLHQAL